MCGEAAADERLIPQLVEWGLDEFSVSPSSILQTRKISVIANDFILIFTASISGRFLSY